MTCSVACKPLKQGNYYLSQQLIEYSREECPTSFMCTTDSLSEEEGVGRLMNNAKGGEQLFSNKTFLAVPFNHLLYHLTWYS
ncbi:hypothetical protein AV530_010554 [Patagioenas fasciata monilis]|uniref:Uncharacterized protein n=1 Tax=Patagioenas fasciata monilis TaxID=372326 RepID=A0A1V4KFD5_PATFA|nr:hypothetical protein AV530_010554 [Patagioenas fasciata monilis]